MKRKNEAVVTRSARRRTKKDEEQEQEDFESKCYMLNLPGDWRDDVEECDLECISKNAMQYIDEEYFAVRRILLNKTITIDGILEMRNITQEDKARLLEKYGILRGLDHDAHAFIEYRNRLLDEIVELERVSKKQRLELQSKRARITSVPDNISSVEEKILSIKLDPSYIRIIHSKYMKLSSMSSHDNEYHKLKEWIDVVTSMPFGIYKTLKSKMTVQQFLKHARTKLDESLFGMNNVKEEIILMLAHKLLNPNASNVSLALVGPPGVGKTQIVKAMAEIIGLPYEHISMGGVNDVSYLGGHSYTYEGARPGKIATALQRMGCNNGMLFFDEVDKIGQTTHGLEVSNQLIHITDFTQNMSFQDKYMPEVPIDLSRMWFMFSMNDEKEINPILHNRLRVIKVSGYSTKDKHTIIRSYLLPACYQAYAVNEDDYTFTDAIINHIIDKTPKEEGVRELKRSIEHIFVRLQLAKHVSDHSSFGFKVASPTDDIPHELTKDEIDSMLVDREKVQGMSLSIMHSMYL